MVSMLLAALGLSECEHLLLPPCGKRSTKHIRLPQIEPALQPPTMNTLIRCLRAAEYLRHPPVHNTHEADSQHIAFRDAVRTGAVAAWVLQSESEIQSQPAIDTCIQAPATATSSCPGAFNYYDYDLDSGSDSASTSTAQRADISEKRRHRRRPRQKCSCAQREETADGYEAETEWWCRHDLQHNRECRRYIYTLDRDSAEQEINEIFFGKGSLCKMLRWRCRRPGGAAQGRTRRPFVVWD
ncbi:hypothetical protein LTR24_009927 [Lithohypha guttulata]|uniref:Uncharacterized protein n=1 Tax=Lithohypha guttulata TaxID=1690604 RepID=A0ABR0JWE5_9EURO|nr:hypothetical protein LTR24_009927 [Lithohypha guttulata]